MRWLLLKDLQILRRTPLQAALLVIYPVLISVLVGFAISRGPDKPRVAFLNQVPKGETLPIGRGDFDLVGARNELCQRIECVRVHSRSEAVRKVEEGEVLGALILPEDLVEDILSLQTLNPRQPTVQFLVNEEDPVKQRLVDDRITTLVTEANLVLSREVLKQADAYLDLIVSGGTFDLLGTSFPVLGLEATEEILEAVRPQVGGASREALDGVIRFATLARQNLDLANPLLESVSEPIRVDKRIVSGDAPPLDVFAIAVAATVTLMFVTVLLVAGSLALEREENAFARLTRGLVSQVGLVVEKVVLGMLVAFAVTLLLLGGLELFVNLEWGRIPLWLVAILAGGAGFAAAGAALGAAAREVRASSLLAFMVSLPIAFLSLVPSGAVGAGLFDVIEVVTALFPFKPALDAMEAALDEAGPGLGAPLVHLAALTAAYGLLARFALRRFGAV